MNADSFDETDNTNLIEVSYGDGFPLQYFPILNTDGDNLEATYLETENINSGAEIESENKQETDNINTEAETQCYDNFLVKESIFETLKSENISLWHLKRMSEHDISELKMSLADKIVLKDSIKTYFKENNLETITKSSASIISTSSERKSPSFQVSCAFII